MKMLKEDIRDNQLYAYSAIDNTKDSTLFTGSSTLSTIFLTGRYNNVFVSMQWGSSCATHKDLGIFST